MPEVPQYIYLQPAQIQSTNEERGATFYDDDRLDLWSYWRTIEHHRLLILTLLIVIPFLTAIGVFLATPLYMGKSVILIQRDTPQLLDTKTADPGDDLPDTEHDFYKTEEQILKSRELAATVIHQLNLEADPAFLRQIRPNPLIAALDRLFASLGGRKRGERSEATSSKQDILGVSASLIDAYLSYLRVGPVPGTRLVDVEFISPDPLLAANVANSHVHAFIERGIELNAQADEEGEHFLDEKLHELKDKIDRSEAALDNYRQKHGIVELPSDNKDQLLMDNLSELNRQLVNAESARITLEAQVQLLKKGSYDSLPQVLSNLEIQQLESQLSAMQADYASMAAEFTPAYVPLADERAKIIATRKRLQQEIDRIAGGIESSYRAALSAEKGFKQRLAEENAKALAENTLSIQGAILQREVDTNQQLYQTVLGQMRQMEVAADAQTSNISVVDRAEVPDQPASPKKLLCILVALLLATSGGVGIAFLLDYLDDTLKDPEEVERFLRVPNLGLVPDFQTLASLPTRDNRSLSCNGSGHTSAEQDKAANALSVYGTKDIITRGRSLTAAEEAYKTIRIGLTLAQAGQHPRSIAFTSGTAGEGKTVTAINSAIAFSHTGASVLLIDADMRRPNCHNIFDCDNSRGLTEVLAGQSEIADVIKTTSVSGLSLVTAGSMPPNPAELLGSREMTNLLETLTAAYDYVLFDTAPIMPISDSVVLSKLMDGVVLVVGPGTPRPLVLNACRRLRRVGCKIFGVVLNGVDVHNAYFQRHGYHLNAYYSHWRQHQQSA